MMIIVVLKINLCMIKLFYERAHKVVGMLLFKLRLYRVSITTNYNSTYLNLNLKKNPCKTIS
jgi:hypothetical protein